MWGVWIKPSPKALVGTLEIPKTSSKKISEVLRILETPREPLEKLLIMGHPLSLDGLAQPSEVLSGKEMDRRMTDTLGGLLSFKPGLQSTFFGPSVGRPVIHGFDGVRVKVMEDRVDTMDLSASSSDHSVSISPLIATKVEILKGANTLLYGSGAIGGVVNVHTGRVPSKISDESFVGKIDLRTTDNGGARQGALRLDGGNKDFFAWHFDGFFKDSNDVSIPGFAQSAPIRAALEENEEHDQEDHEKANPIRGKLPFSHYQTHGSSIGFSFIDGDESFMGISLSQLKKEYGLPGFSHSHEEEEHHDESNDHVENEDEDEHHEAENEEGQGPYIDLDQVRVDLKIAISEPLSGWEDFKFDLGLNNYEHTEVEGSGKVGTKFENEAWEVRMEATHNPVAQWSGIVGLQSGHRNKVIFGKEALTPPVITDSYGLFWVGQKNFENFQLETGTRFDYVSHNPKERASEEFTGGSASLGVTTPFKNSWKVSGQVDYASRAPMSEELFSNGPHFASRSFEMGDPNLDNENALNFSTTLSYQSESWSTLVTAYLTEFTNFIHLMDTGGKREELPLRQFTQNKATFTGFDVEFSFPMYVWEKGRLELTTFFDTVSAQVDVSGNKNLPRIPPSRIGVGLELISGPMIATLDYLHAFEQKDIADYELATDAYNDLQAYLGWDFPISRFETSLFVLGRNLTNSEQRRHTSVIKDIAPERGRSIEGGLRIIF